MSGAWGRFQSDLVSRTVTQGHAEAANAMFGIYRQGHGVAVDYAVARAAALTAAELGHVKSMFDVGMCWHKGVGGPMDNKQAVSWFEKAAAADDPDAVGQLGYMCEEGFGQTPSFRRARQYYERAAELGESRAKLDVYRLTQFIAVRGGLPRGERAHSSLAPRSTPPYVDPFPSAPPSPWPRPPTPPLCSPGPLPSTPPLDPSLLSLPSAPPLDTPPLLPSHLRTRPS